MLKKRRGNLKIAIVRPSIVISALDEPLVGWTETISALGGVLFATMLGLINFLHCNEKQVIDLVPVDYVSNLILAGTAYTARQGGLEVFHSSSSSH